MKRISFIFLLIIFFQFTITNIFGFFPDVPTGHKFENEINFIQEEGIASGYSDGNFYPDRFVTRGEFAKMIAIGFEVPKYEYKRSFNDVTIDSEFYEYIMILANSDYKESYFILDTVNDKDFNESEYITREDAVIILDNAIDSIGFARGVRSEVPRLNELTEKYGDEFSIEEFDQLSELESSLISLYWLKNVSDDTCQPLTNPETVKDNCDFIISGYSDNYFHPDRNITRGQTAKIIAKALNHSTSTWKVDEITKICNSVGGEYSPLRVECLNVDPSICESIGMHAPNDNRNLCIPFFID